MLMTLFYHYIEFLYWPGDKKSQEIEWEVVAEKRVYRHTQGVARTNGVSAFGRRGQLAQSAQSVSLATCPLHITKKKTCVLGNIWRS